jgi:hypothetical protein
VSKNNNAALIAAGAVLPGIADTGDNRDTITARHYVHPALDDRVVVRLTPAVLGRAEDLTCEYLGFGAPVRTAEVGTGRRSALGFPAWALVHDPANSHHALNLVKDVERLARTARSRAGAAKDGFTSLGEMLGRSAPHFLPTFYEQAGRIFLEHGNTTYAATMFGKAREAEEVHDLAVDPERIREVFLEFAFAGALTAKALSAHAKGLARKHDPDAAYELFLTLCVERTRGGLPPYTGMPEDLRRLAKAAKRDLPVEDERLLRAVLDSSAISRAGTAFWKTYRDPLVAVATADTGVRGQLLSFVPSSAAVLDTWLDILGSCGATRALIEPAGEWDVVPAEWLSSVLAIRSGGWRTTDRSEALLELVEAMADRLVADAVPVRALTGWRQDELDVLDLLVHRGVAIADGEHEEVRFEVAHWLADEGPGHRDLAALGASERFALVLGEGFVAHARNTTRTQTASTDLLLTALAVPGLRAALRVWITTHATGIAATGLPDLARHLAALAVVKAPEAFADVPEAAETIAATDVAHALQRTLRIGLFDELGWPALEEAVARLSSVGAAKDEEVVVCGEGWPALVLRRGEHFVVIGPDGVLAEHVSRIPADARHRWQFAPAANWLDGVLLVRWHGPDGELAYWSDAPDHVFDPGEVSRSYYSRDAPSPSIALPGGARFTGRRALHHGDTQVPPLDQAFGDGTSVWTCRYHEQTWRWFEVDPATGELGRLSVPRFVEDFAADGAAIAFPACDLRPAVPATETSPLGVADGLHGWRVRAEPDGSWFGEGVDGRQVRLPKGADQPNGVLRLPGGGQLVLTAGYNEVRVLDEHGILLGDISTAGRHPAYAAGTPFMVPMAWWHAFRTRDEAGSAALRGVTRETVEEMLAAALAAEGPDEETLRDVVARGVTAALPGLTHQGLIAGVVDVVRRAASQLSSFRGYGEIAAAARAVDLDALAPSGPSVTEEDLNAALSWFGGGYRSNGTTRTTLPSLIAALAETAAQPEPAGRALPESLSPGWFGFLPHLAALAHRAASPLTPDEQREALVLLLRTLTDHGLTEGTGHWRTVAVVVPDGSANPVDRVVPVPGGFLAVFYQHYRHDPGTRYDGVQFSRTPGEFTLPRDWHLEGASEVRAPFGGARITRFLDVLAERGPVPWFPEAASELAERTGLGASETTVLLAGMPGVDQWGATYLSTAERQLLGLSAGGAKAAKERLKRLDNGYRWRLLAAALPEDPADLWTTGPDVAAVAEVWTSQHGIRLPVPDDVLVDAVKLLPMRDTGELVTGLVNPDSTSWLTTDPDFRVNGTALEARHPEGFAAHSLTAVPQGLLWLAQRLPVGSPLRASLPAALSLARQRVAHPGFAIDLGGWTSLSDTCALIGIEPPAPGTVAEHRGWLEVVAMSDEYCRVVVRPGLAGPQDRDLLVALAETTYSPEVVRALDMLADDNLEAACAVTAPEGVDPNTYYQDPTVSAPNLVAEVAGKFGLDEDAAVLYLQLLALPDPTDANVARWTGWKPNRLKKARASLGATDLVLTAKRARAGRSLFLPGGWLALSSPHLPLESWKASMFGFTTDPEGVIAPREPVADLFARAWRRVLDGDAPAYEELKTGGRR